MKVLESVGKEGHVSIDNMQFGFMPGKGTTAFLSCDNYKRNTKQRRRSCTMLLKI